MELLFPTGSNEFRAVPEMRSFESDTHSVTHLILSERRQLPQLPERIVGGSKRAGPRLRRFVCSICKAEGNDITVKYSLLRCSDILIQLPVEVGRGHK